MKKVTELKKGNYILTHDRYIDGFGFEKDVFDFFDIKKRVHYPFLVSPKVNNYKRTDPIKTTTDYTEKEYQQIFKEQKSRLPKFLNE